MLSRAAEALFWIGRYVERAEDTARLLDVHFHEIIEDPEVDEGETCRVVADRDGAARAGAASPCARCSTCSPSTSDNPSSIVGSLGAARQNARGVREALSAEIWECLNTTDLELPRRVSAARQFGPAPFFSYVRQRAAMFAGYVTSTISRDSGYDFFVLGRSLERADMTARLLAAAVEHARTARALADDAAGVLGARGLPADVPARGRGPPGARVPAARPAVPAVGDPRPDRRRGCLARLEPPAQRNGRGPRDDTARRVIGRVLADLEFLQPDQCWRACRSGCTGSSGACPTVSEIGRQELLRHGGRRRLEPRGVAAMSVGMVHQ